MRLLLSCIFADNWKSQYLKKGEVTPGVQAGEYDGEVRSDITTSFFILLAIFFPSVTGRLAVKNRLIYFYCYYQGLSACTPSP